MALVQSAVYNGQLIPIAPSNAISPPAAGQPTISSGAGAQNLPGGGSGMGGGAVNPAGVQSNAGNSVPNLAGVAGNVWALPLWQNPLVFVLAMLFLAYLMLRFVHWRA